MIVWNIDKLDFSYHPFYYEDNLTIEIRTIWGKPIKKLSMDGSGLTVGDHKFSGSFNKLKLFRYDNVVPSFKVQLFCHECGEIIYNLSGKLPKIFVVKTNFHVTKRRK